MNQPQSSVPPSFSKSSADGTDYDLLLDSLHQTSSTGTDLNQIESTSMPDLNSTQSLIIPSSSQLLFSSAARPRPTSELIATSEGTFLKKKLVKKRKSQNNVFLRAVQEKDEECKKMKAVVDLHKSCAKNLKDAKAKTRSAKFSNKQFEAQVNKLKKSPTESIAKPVNRLKEANKQIGDLLNSDKRLGPKIKCLKLYQQKVSDFCDKTKELSKLSNYPLLSDIKNVNKFPESCVLPPQYSNKDSSSDVFTDVNSLKCIRKLLEDHKQEIIENLDQKIENVVKKIENVDKKIENVDKKIENVDKKIENVDKKIENVDKKFTQIHSEILDLLKNCIDSKGIRGDEILQEQHSPPMLSPISQDFVTTREKEPHIPSETLTVKIGYYFNGIQQEVRPNVFTLELPPSSLMKE